MTKILIPDYDQAYEYALKNNKSCFAIEAYLPLPNDWGIEKYSFQDNLIFLNKNYECMIIFNSIQTIVDDNHHFKGTVTCFLPAKNYIILPKLLRKSEYKVIELLLQSYTDQQIARMLNIIMGVVRLHISNICNRLHLPKINQRRSWLLKLLESNFIVKN